MVVVTPLSGTAEVPLAASRRQFGVVGHAGPLLGANRSVLRPGSYENSVVVTTMLIRISVKKPFLRPEKNGYLVLYGIWRKNTDQNIDFYDGDLCGFPPGPGPIPLLQQGPAQNRRARGGSGFFSAATRRAVRPRRPAQDGRRAAPDRSGRRGKGTSCLPLKCRPSSV